MVSFSANIPDMHTLMKNKKSRSRRKYPRFEKCLKFELKTDGDLITAETLNLSLNGALCGMDREIPVMTRLNIVIELPGGDVQCNGVVVRSEETGTPGVFHTAIFFDDIEDSESGKLLKFIDPQSVNAMYRQDCN